MLQAIKHPVHRRVGPGHAVQDHEAFVLIAAVEGGERFHHVAVADDQPGGEQHLAHVVEVAHGDEIFEAKEFPHGNRKRQHHGKSRVNRARDEVGRKNRRVPSGNDGEGKVKTHDRVHGEDQRRREAGQQQGSRFVPLPMNRRAAPSHREQTINQFRRRDFWRGRAASPGPESGR